MPRSRRHPPTFTPRTPAMAALATALLAASGASQAQSSIGIAGSPNAATVLASTDRLIIKYRPGTRAALAANTSTMAAAHQVAHQAGVQMQRLRANGQAANVMALDRSLSLAGARQLAQQIAAADSDVLYAEPDLRLSRQLTPNDPSYASQWHYTEATAGINAPAAWASSTGSGVVVAVVDTGYRPHADLAANLLTGYDFVSTSAAGNDGNGRDASALDPGDAVAANECGSGTSAEASSWHGTHVAGTVAAVTGNGLGVAGAAPGAKLLPVRVLGKCGGYTSDIADGLLWAAGGSISGVPANPTPARVINLSLGGSGSCGSTLQAAITSARALGALVVVAAGNSSTGTGSANSTTPANCTGAFTVTAVNRLGAKAWYANTGSVVALAAPGGDTRSASTDGILSTLNTGTSTPGADSYGWYQGTSMATPHVAAVAALVLARYPALSVSQLEAALRSGVRPLAASCSGCGAGIIDAGLALSAAASAGSGSTTSSNTSVAEAEPNNTVAAAQVVDGGVAGSGSITVSGTLSSRADLDVFRITLAAGQALSAVLTPGSTTANLDLAVYTANGSLLGSSRSGGNGVAESLAYTPSVATSLLVAVSSGTSSIRPGPGGGSSFSSASYSLKLTR